MAFLSYDTIELIPWRWDIPAALVQFNLEDQINSEIHHYGVFASQDNLVQATEEDRWQFRPDLSRRLRKVSKLLEEKKITLVLPSTKRKRQIIQCLFRYPNIRQQIRSYREQRNNA